MHNKITKKSQKLWMKEKGSNLVRNSEDVCSYADIKTGEVW